MKLPASITTERLLIRPFTVDDADEFVAFMTAEGATEYMFSEEQKTPGGAEKFFDIVIASYSTEKKYFLCAITLKGSGEFAGCCGVSGVLEECVFEPFCCLLPAHRHHGYAIESLRGLIDYCFTKCSMREVRAYIHVDNHKSVRLASRVGLSRLGPGEHPLSHEESVVYSLGRTK